MPVIVGKTIDQLNQVTAITASDELVVYDAEAGTGVEPTKKVTGSNLASSVKTLGSLLGTSDVVNDLTNTDPTKVLAAPQGKGLNDKIESLFATVTALTPARSGDVISGGYIKVGKAVIVSFKLTLASNVSANTAIVANSPNANISGTLFLSGFADAYGKRGNMFTLRDYIGTLITNTDMEAGNYVFCGCYIAE